MKTVLDFNFKNEIALIRVDFNVPQDLNLNVSDSTRILASKKTIDKILSDGGSIVLITHFGRPKGVRLSEYSLNKIVSTISNILRVPIKFIPDCIGEIVTQEIDNLKRKEVLLLENLRFYPEEEKGDISFAQELAKNGTFYVNDAFSVAHRSHASTAFLSKFFKKKKCFGLLMKKELTALDKILKTNKKPITAILGGSKISTKISMINNLLPLIDNLIIGGAMAYTFIKVLGGNIGSSFFEKNKLEEAQLILKKIKEYKIKFILPDDSIVADKSTNDANIKIVSSNRIPYNYYGFDIGPKAIKNNHNIILESRTILWNGPMGLFENSLFLNGTKSICESIKKATKLGSFSLVGGGDSIAFIKQNNYNDDFSYISTGGGAMLSYLSGKTLPGISCMLD